MPSVLGEDTNTKVVGLAIVVWGTFTVIRELTCLSVLMCCGGLQEPVVT